MVPSLRDRCDSARAHVAGDGVGLMEAGVVEQITTWLVWHFGVSG